MKIMNNSKVCHWFNVCPLKEFYQQGRIDESWVEDYCRGNYSNCVRRKMEDEGVCHPDNMMPDGTIDRNLK